MYLKENINKIHIDLINSFTEVTINEKSDKNQNYFEILIKEGAKELKVILDKKQIENKNFQWYYFSNPLNEKSTLVNRFSNLESIVGHIKDIFEKNRFDEEYIKILENNTHSNKIDKIVDINIDDISYMCRHNKEYFDSDDLDICNDFISDNIVNDELLKLYCTHYIEEQGDLYNIIEFHYDDKKLYGKYTSQGYPAKVSFSLTDI